MMMVKTERAETETVTHPIIETGERRGPLDDPDREMTSDQCN